MSLLTGFLTRLVALDPEADAPLHARWSTDSEYARLFNYGPNRPYELKATRDYLEGELEQAHYYGFSIRPLTEDRTIGLTDLYVTWPAREAWFGIGLGDRAYWGRGYGSDALNVILRFAFQELNLHRVSLAVFGFNTRAIRSYEKCGFTHEGRQRRALHRDGQRYDVLQMGLLQHEWKNNF